jgi:hypothetical protein
MSQSAQISIIVPCYNYGQYLSLTLSSVYEQTFENWECIIIDDGSTDNSAEVAMQWVKKDPRFIYIKQDNAGLSAARNTGLKNAKGNYIQFLDADDLIEPKKLEYQLNILGNNEAEEVVYSSFVFQDVSNQRYGPEPHHYTAPKKDILHALIFEWEYGFIMPIHCFLFPKKTLEKIGGFYTLIPTHEDLDLHLRLVMSGVSFRHHPEKFAVYRVHGSSMSRNYTRMQLGYLIALGRGFHNAPNLLNKIKVYTRFGMELAQSVIHLIRGRRINMMAILNNNNSLLTILSILLLPLFLFIKVIRRFV